MIDGELKACPWCKTAKDVAVEEEAEWTVGCSGCGFHGHAFGSRDAAIAAWNKRADDVLEAEVKRLQSLAQGPGTNWAKVKDAQMRADAAEACSGTWLKERNAACQRATIMQCRAERAEKRAAELEWQLKAAAGALEHYSSSSVYERSGDIHDAGTPIYRWSLHKGKGWVTYDTPPNGKPWDIADAAIASIREEI